MSSLSDLGIITSADILNKDVASLDDVPALPASEMKAKFDALSKLVVIPKVNEIIQRSNALLVLIDDLATIATMQGLVTAEEIAAWQQAADRAGVLGYDSAAAHNSIHRGKYLGDAVTNAQWNAIATGTFTNMRVGDYWTIGGIDWVICDFDYYIRCGLSDMTDHHIIIMPRTGMIIPAGTVLYGTSPQQTLTLLSGESSSAFKWNATASAPNTNTTAGGYKYSRMRQIIMKAANTIVIELFGASHVKPITEIYPNPSSATDSGLASSSTIFNDDDPNSITAKSICDLCNETMVYGQQVWGLGNAYGSVGHEIGYDKFQLSIFQLDRSFANIRGTWWLRSAYSATGASDVNAAGHASGSGSANASAVRPRFLLVG